MTVSKWTVGGAAILIALIAACGNEEAAREQAASAAAQASQSAEAKARADASASAAAEAQRQAEEAEAQRQAEEAEAQRQAEEAEAQRQAEAAAEAQRQAEAAAALANSGPIPDGTTYWSDGGGLAYRLLTVRNGGTFCAVVGYSDAPPLQGTITNTAVGVQQLSTQYGAETVSATGDGGIFVPDSITPGAPFYPVSSEGVPAELRQVAESACRL